jgi:Flp pilus assembly pilin Flp
VAAALHPARSVERRSNGSYRTKEITAVRVHTDITPNDFRDERGQAMIEYSLIVALVTVVAFGLVGAIGIDTSNLYAGIRDEIHAIFG